VRRVSLAQLDLDHGVRERLLALGVETVGDFLRLPGDGIRQRFGAAADTLYQRASGRRWSPLVPVAADEPQERTLHFDTPESNTERLVFVVKRLLDSLLAALTSRAQAVTELVLSMTLDDKSTRLERIRPASATLEAAQLLVLVRLRLDAVHLSAGIVTLRVSADTCSAAPHQRQLLHEARRDADAANQALARLGAECGEQCVVRARVCDAHLPSARFVWEPLAHVTALSAPRVVASRPLVRRIYAQPLPVASGFGRPALPMALSDVPGARRQTSDAELGPYIVSGGWWGGGVRRDYYFRHAEDGNLRWVYYDHRKARVFAQGGVE